MLKISALARHRPLCASCAYVCVCGIYKLFLDFKWLCCFLHITHYIEECTVPCANLFITIYMGALLQPAKSFLDPFCPVQEYTILAYLIPLLLQARTSISFLGLNVYRFSAHAHTK